MVSSINTDQITCGNFTGWKAYWNDYLFNKYGKQEVESESDLFFQVARTVSQNPIGRSVFEYIIDDIIEKMALAKEDVLVDFCCGNGLFTYELRDQVSRIIGVDFAPQIIQTANAFKCAANINYYQNDVIGFLKNFKRQFPGIRPNKYLNNDSLAYFSIKDLAQILQLIVSISGKDFCFLLRGVPNTDLMWNFYNTEERKEKYYGDISNGDYSNGGLGNWWAPGDIERVCTRLNLKCHIQPQNDLLSNYRMDVIIGDS